jgi:hypothetical protein
VVFVVIYLFRVNFRLRNQIISMGRLIPTIQMVVVGGSIPPRQVVQVCPPQPQQTMTPYSSAQAPPPAPPAGFYPPQDYPPQDYPPPYSLHEQKP